MFKFVVLYALLACCMASTLPSLSGKIIGIPEELNTLQRESKTTPQILNGLNYQSRFKLLLIPLTDGQDSRQGVLERNYGFKFDLLAPGEYQLIVNSHDFLLNLERFRVFVEDTERDQQIEDDEQTPIQQIKVYQEKLIKESYNVSSGQIITKETPLVIEIKGYKEYYEIRLGSIWDMVMNSPFGFIFANKVYTILFTICSGIIVTPYILLYVAPEFANQFEEVQQRVNEGRQGQTIQNRDVPQGRLAPSAAKPGSGLRQRK